MHEVVVEKSNVRTTCMHSFIIRGAITELKLELYRVDIGMISTTTYLLIVVVKFIVNLHTIPFSSLIFLPYSTAKP